MKLNLKLIGAVAGAVLLVAAVFAIGMGLGFHRGKTATLSQAASDDLALTKQQLAFAKRLMEAYPDLEELEFKGKKTIKQPLFWAWLNESLDDLTERQAQQEKQVVEVIQATWRIGQEDCALAASEGHPHSDEVRAQAAGEVLSSWYEDRFGQRPGWPAALLVAASPGVKTLSPQQRNAKTQPLPRSEPEARQSIMDVSALPSVVTSTKSRRLEVPTGDVAVTQSNLKFSKGTPGEEPDLVRLLDLPKNAIRQAPAPSPPTHERAADGVSPEVRERYRRAFPQSP